MTNSRPRVQLTIPSKALGFAFVLLSSVPLLNTLILLGPVRAGNQQLKENSIHISQDTETRSCLALVDIPLRDAESTRDNVLSQMVSALVNRTDVARLNQQLTEATREVTVAFDRWRAAVLECQNR